MPVYRARYLTTSDSCPPKYPRLELHGLLDLVSRQDDIPWKPFLEGLDVHRLYGDGISGPTAALLRFRKAAVIPRHFHPGFEHILVLAGKQTDQNGEAAAGTLVINPPGTEHEVAGEEGCIVLAIYQESVVFR